MHYGQNLKMTKTPFNLYMNKALCNEDSFLKVFLKVFLVFLRLLLSNEDASKATSTLHMTPKNEYDRKGNTIPFLPLTPKNLIWLAL